MRLGVCPARGTHLTSSSTPGPRPTSKLRLRSPSPPKKGGDHNLILFLCDVIIAAGGHVDLNLTASTVGDAGQWFCVLCCRHTGAVKVKPSTVYCGTEFYFSATVLMTKEHLLHFGSPTNSKFQNVWQWFEFQSLNPRPHSLPPVLSCLWSLLTQRII